MPYRDAFLRELTRFADRKSRAERSRLLPRAISIASEPMSEIAVTAELVRPGSRLYALPRHFGAEFMLAVEREIVLALKELAADYCGGHWHFYELSNGGFYMAPDLGSTRNSRPRQ
jgi:hypothetical protein